MVIGRNWRRGNRNGCSFWRECWPVRTHLQDAPRIQLFSNAMERFQLNTTCLGKFSQVVRALWNCSIRSRNDSSFGQFERCGQAALTPVAFELKGPEIDCWTTHRFQNSHPHISRKQPYRLWRPAPSLQSRRAGEQGQSCQPSPARHTTCRPGLCHRDYPIGADLTALA